jgi:tetraacyldisaccharide-1-P 4'-kinase
MVVMGERKDVDGRNRAQIEEYVAASNGLLGTVDFEVFGQREDEDLESKGQECKAVSREAERVNEKAENKNKTKAAAQALVGTCGIAKDQKMFEVDF